MQNLRAMTLPITALTQTAAIRRTARARAERHITAKLTPATTITHANRDCTNWWIDKSNTRQPAPLQKTSNTVPSLLVCRESDATEEVEFKPARQLWTHLGNFRHTTLARKWAGAAPRAAQQLPASDVLRQVKHLHFLCSNSPTAAAQQLLVLVIVSLRVKSSAVAIAENAVRIMNSR
jgi:hypothetical protein